jgi:hypothetical protein
MGYANIDTTPGAAHSTDPKTNKTYDPYKRFVDQAAPSRLLLRPPAEGGSHDDPYIAALTDIAGLVHQSTKVLRGVAAPWLAMPPDGESFHQAAGITIPAIGASLSTVVSITCPQGRNGVLNRIANTFIGGGFNDFSGNIIWQILRNPSGVSPFPVSGVTAAERNYQNIQASLGMTLAPTPIAPIRIFENDVIVLAVENVSVVVAGQLIGGLFGGWFYPRTWDDLFDQRSKVMDW